MRLRFAILLCCLLVALLSACNTPVSAPPTPKPPVPTPTPTPIPTPIPPPTPAAPTATDILNKAVKAMQKQQGYTYSTTSKSTSTPYDFKNGSGWSTTTETGTYKTLVNPYAMDGSSQLSVNSSSSSLFNVQAVGVANIYTNGTLYIASESVWQPVVTAVPYAQLEVNDPLYLLSSLQTLHPHRLHLSQDGSSYMIQINLDASTSNITLMKKYASLLRTPVNNFTVEHFTQTVWINSSTMLVTKVTRDYKFSYQIYGFPGSKEESFSLTVNGPFNGTISAPM